MTVVARHEAHVAEVSTPAVDDLVALGIDSGISRSEVSRICAGPDEVVTALRTRRLTLPPRVRRGHLPARTQRHLRGVIHDRGRGHRGHRTGDREVLGLIFREREDEMYWRALPHGSEGPRLSGLRLVISDQVAALRRSLHGWRINAAGCIRLQPAGAGAQDHTDMLAGVFRTKASPASTVLIRMRRADRQIAKLTRALALREYRRDHLGR